MAVSCAGEVHIFLGFGLFCPFLVMVQGDTVVQWFLFYFGIPVSLRVSLCFTCSCVPSISDYVPHLKCSHLCLGNPPVLSFVSLSCLVPV